MKRLFTSIFALLIGFAAFSQAEIKFETNTLDYGTIEKGSDGVRSLSFKNVGDEALEIEKVNSSCGCTIPKKPKGKIAPGASNEIQVKYDTNRVGPIRKTITVYTNGEPAIVPIKIKGRVTDKKNQS
jgi:hypothetical protein